MTTRAPERQSPARAVVFRLYVAGEGPNSLEARANLEAFLADQSDSSVTLEIVDVLRHPDQGLRDSIVVTPTLVRTHPLPEQRIIGNLRDRTAMLVALLHGGENHD